MATLSNVTIDWSVSPRIIEVSSNTTSITVQNLYDTVRNLASQTGAMDDDEIISGSGKEDLGGSVLVGITVTLLNAKLKFEERGVATTCFVGGGNLVAEDGNGDSMFCIEPSANVTVQLSQSTSASIIANDEVAIADEIMDRGVLTVGKFLALK